MKKLLVIGLLLGSQLSYASNNQRGNYRSINVEASSSSATTVILLSDRDERCLKVQYYVSAGMMIGGVALIGSSIVYPDQSDYLISAGAISYLAALLPYVKARRRLGFTDCLDDSRRGEDAV